MSIVTVNIYEPLALPVSRGDERAFRALFDKYYDGVAQFLKQYTKNATVAEDLAQDIFTKLWISRESLSDIKCFKSFLFVLAKNHALNWIRKELRERERIKKWGYLQAAVQNDMNEETDIVDEAVMQLPQQQKQAWILSRREGMKYEEVAHKMNISKETVKKYIQYANEKIKKNILLRLAGLIIFIFTRL